MKDTSKTEENYLKIIYKLEVEKRQVVSTNKLAELTQTKPASVSEMLKKLAKRGFIDYQPYKGVKLNEKGLKVGATIVRKHRLWETFLVHELDYEWDEIHEIAEQLEHIESETLINKIDKKLHYPKFDPHGDPIPNKQLHVVKNDGITLKKGKPGEKYFITGIKNNSQEFIQTLKRLNIKPGTEIKYIDSDVFDNSIQLLIDGRREMISDKISSNIYIKSSANHIKF